MPKLSELIKLLGSLELRFLLPSTMLKNVAETSQAAENGARVVDTASNKPKLQCQICQRNGHTADRRYKRFNRNFQTPSQPKKNTA